ncbi:hypothetical protein GCM10011611_51380 [Aliidongia dinghuensis]|uniref:Uncharacterized protein n=1 Tax=Aliidongia dinghuensis TaxID=1867774 RepID=A0A8J2YXZ9_9PROT|nr:hypothetical protein GCM10011611_51380 [Aliidongia dinghuensis]
MPLATNDADTRTLMKTLDRPERLVRAGMGAVADLVPGGKAGDGDGGAGAERTEPSSRPSRLYVGVKSLADHSLVKHRREPLRALSPQRLLSTDL